MLTTPKSLISRRRWLQTAAVAAQVALPSFTAFGQNRAVHFDNHPFSLGVASGFPQSDGASLWTRLAPAPMEPEGGMPPHDVALRCEIAADESFANVLRRLPCTALAQWGHSVHLQVQGLPSATLFFYRFVVQGLASPTGRFKTAPAANAPTDSLRIALASCQHYEAGYFTAHRDMAAQDLDFVMFVGDYIYESNYPKIQRLRQHNAGAHPTSLAQYRQRYALYKMDADLQACHAAHAWVFTWDDHEVENDYANSAGLNWTPVEAFLAQRAAAYQAYFEHMPLPPSPLPAGPDYAMYRELAWGQLAHLWILDNRQYRTPHACPGADKAGGRLVGECAALAEGSRTMLGAAQEQWLGQSVAKRLSASPGGPKPWVVLGQATQLASGILPSPLGPRTWTDGWDGYPKARERLLASLASSQSALVLGGDVHRNVAANLRMVAGDAASPVLASEFVATSITSRGSASLAIAAMRAANPDLLHARADERGYALIDIKAKRTECEFRATEHPVRQASSFTTQARFVVQRNQPGVETA